MSVFVSLKSEQSSIFVPVDLSLYGVFFLVDINVFNSSALGQNGLHFADDILKCIFGNEKFCILIQISLKFVRKGPIGNKLALV